MLDVLEFYNSRNEEAHKPPPVMKHFIVKEDEEWVIDWKSMESAFGENARRHP